MTPLPDDETLLPSEAERQELEFSFDALVFDFRSLLIDIFRSPISGIDIADLEISEGLLTSIEKNREDCGLMPCARNSAESMFLSNLHLTPAGRKGCQKGSNTTLFHIAYNRVLRSSFAKGPDAVIAKDLQARHDSLMLSFCRNIVAPLIGCNADEVAFQRSPTLRVSFPSDEAIGRPHCDAEYHHQAGELNFWLPCTAVWGANTLQVESSPGKADYHPLNVSGFGKGIRFWGNRVYHFCYPNSTSFTRVSLDFRAISVKRYDPSFIDCRGRASNFLLGGFYRLSTMSVDDSEKEVKE